MLDPGTLPGRGRALRQTLLMLLLHPREAEQAP
jgi:hypothetical protein